MRPTKREHAIFEAAGLFHSIGEFGERYSIRARAESATLFTPEQIGAQNIKARYQYGPAVFQATKLQNDDWLAQCFNYPTMLADDETTHGARLAAFLKTGDKVHESRIGSGLQAIVLLQFFAIIAATCAVDIPHAKRVLKEFQPGELNT